MKQKTVIGLMAKAQSGKSTTAKYLVKEYGATLLSISKPIKTIVQAMFGFTDEQTWGDLKEVVDERWGITPRKPMQDLGLLGREVLGNGVWINGAMEEMFKSDNTLFVFEDFRYESEIDLLDSLKYSSRCPTRGLALKLNYLDRETTDDGTHVSESGIDLIPESRFESVISHVKTPGGSDLLSQIDGIMTALEIGKSNK
jgi:hypothetical protein